MSKQEIFQPQATRPVTIKNLVAAFGDVWVHEGVSPQSAARRVMTAVRTKGVDEALEAINKLIGGFGVESVSDERAPQVDRYYYQIQLLYVNTGDSYLDTILYDTQESTFGVGSVGGWLEVMEPQWILESLQDGHNLSEEDAKRIYTMLGGPSDTFYKDTDVTKALQVLRLEDIVKAGYAERDARRILEWIEEGDLEPTDPEAIELAARELSLRYEDRETLPLFAGLSRRRR